MNFDASPTTSNQRTLQNPHVTVLVDRCAGCEECIVRCPTGALALDPGTWTVVANDVACVGCQQCERTCPFDAIVVVGRKRLAPRIPIEPHTPRKLDGDLHETRLGIGSWVDALTEADRCLACPDPTCVRGCPLHNDIPGFIAAIRAGDLDHAHEVLQRTTVLSDICSRVCDQAIQCEGACSWSLAGAEPVAIGALERFVSDNAPVPPPRLRFPRQDRLSVAIVGSGPAAIAAAWRLIESGASVTVYEKDEWPGGLLRWGIPDFTLSEARALRPWDALVASGVKLHCNTWVNPQHLDHLAKRYDAVILAYGAGSPIRPLIDGDDLDGVWDSTTFLKKACKALREGTSFLDEEARLSLNVDRQPTVVVVGGGNTAMDVARLSRRLGARAICIDWMNRKFAPVRPNELEEAQDEGVEILFERTISSIQGALGHVTWVTIDRTKQTSPTHSPKVVQEKVDTLRADLVVFAMGYRRDPQWSEALEGLFSPEPRRGAIADHNWESSGLLNAGRPGFARHQPIGSLSLSREQRRLEASRSVSSNIWLVGDARSGPSTVVEAASQGRVAADSILERLGDPVGN